MSLDAELTFFERHKAEYLKKYENHYLLIKGNKLYGTFPTAESAYEAGLHEFSLEPFLVRQVLKEELVSFIPSVMSITR